MTSPAERFWAKVEKGDGCWLWTGAVYTCGYGRFTYTDATGRRHDTGAHRFSLALSEGDRPSPMCACHRCDVKPCVRPDHLFWGTQQDNLRDMAEKGRAVRNGRAKLTDEQVAEIRARYGTGTLKALAAEYGVHEQTIFKIAHGLRRKEAA
jgi:hypothetical protein